MTDPVPDDTPTWARDVPSEIHGAIEHLRFTLRDDTGDPQLGGDVWSAVYAPVSLQPSQEEVEQGVRAAVEGDVVGAVNAVRDMLLRVFSDRLHAVLAAHTAVELTLLDRLAEATGTPVATLLDDLDQWAVQRDAG